MTTTEAHRITPLTADQLIEMLQLSETSDSVELKLTVPDADRRKTATALEIDPLGRSADRVPDRPRTGARLDPHGLAARPQGKGDDSRGEAPAGRAHRAPGQAPEVGRLQGRGRCRCRAASCAPARTRASCRPDHGQGRAGRSSADPEAVQQAAARVLRRARPGRDRAGRSGDARADPDAEAEVPARRVQPQDGRRAVDVPRRVDTSSSCPRSARPRRPSRWPPRRRRSSVAGRRPRERAADEDQDRPGVLRQGAREAPSRFEHRGAVVEAPAVPSSWWRTSW